MNSHGKDSERTAQNAFLSEPSVCIIKLYHDRAKIMAFHYANTPMQYTAIFHDCKNVNFQLNIFDYFHIFAQNIDCGYTLEPPR